jgi:hypothetical protein
MKSLFIGATLLALLLTACSAGTVLNPIRGNGNMQVEERELAEFNHIEFSGIGDMDIQIGESSSVSISAEENILPYVLTLVEGDTLRIYTENGVSLDPSTRISYSITTTSLEALDLSGIGNTSIASLETDSLSIHLSGAGNITINDLETESFSLGLSGTGLVTVSGSTAEQVIEISGAGNYEAENFASQTAEVSMSGIGNANLRVSDRIDGAISGVGNLSYIGSPTISVDRSGLGNITQREQ